VKFQRTFPDSQVLEYLKDQSLHIYTIIDHEPMLSKADEALIQAGVTTRSQIADRQRVRDEDGDWYIDEFGRYVYIASRIGTTSADIDLRYDGEPEPELFTLQYVEHGESQRAY